MFISADPKFQSGLHGHIRITPAHEARIDAPQYSHSAVFLSIQLASLARSGAPQFGQLVGRLPRGAAAGAGMGMPLTAGPNSFARASAEFFMPLLVNLRVI